MKVLKLTTTNGSVYHMPLDGFADAQQVELVEMTSEEYHEIPATADAFERFRQALVAD